MTVANHDARILVICQCCDEFDSESAVCHWQDVAVMPNGIWLCDECYRECDKTAYGLVANAEADFEFPEFEDIPRPTIYAVSPGHVTEREALDAAIERMGWPEIHAFQGELKRGQDIREDAGGFMMRAIRRLFGLPPPPTEVETYQQAARRMVAEAEAGR